MPDNQPNPRLTEEEMRRRFNDGKYWERMMAGEFTEIIIGVHKTIHQAVIDRHPGARSVTAHYRDASNTTVVEVHYFQMPDGSVASGMRPDPKLLFEDGVLYHQERKRDREKRLAILREGPSVSE